ncbi:efflux RND transporter periplasmic adaptor subunit [uncultured Shewanella sp.]|uniref:efflux RND transporter periplasmic adaptor subunit n=1 Tax=uncultured Shewanella sp. TaxID=173975 RepID=UPI00262B1BEC|nr:efflux RND transporter periplasmic adaptor subunit [uncultured Shewanella sp.]
MNRILFLLIYIVSGQIQADQAKQVNVRPIGDYRYSRDIQTMGQVISDGTFTVAAPHFSQVQSLLKVGDKVTAGAVVATLDVTDITIKLNAANQQLVLLQQQITLQNSELSRLTTLNQQQFVAQRERDLLALLINSLKQKYNEIKRTKDLLEWDISRSQIVSPVSGIVLQRHVNIGSYPVKGSDMLEIADDQQLLIKASFPIDTYDLLQVGDKINIHEDTTTMKGTISRILPSGHFSNQSISVYISLDDVQSLPIGQNLSISWQEDRRLYYLLPKTLISGFGNDAFVYSINSQNKVIEVAVGIISLKGEGWLVAVDLSADKPLILTQKDNFKVGEAVLAISETAGSFLL